MDRDGHHGPVHVDWCLAATTILLVVLAAIGAG